MLEIPGKMRAKKTSYHTNTKYFQRERWAVSPGLGKCFSNAKFLLDRPVSSALQAKQALDTPELFNVLVEIRIKYWYCSLNAFFVSFSFSFSFSCYLG